MSGGGAEFEYPDEAGYPDGMGTLHEGTDGARSDEAAEADTTEEELEEFATQDEEDVDGNV